MRLHRFYVADDIELKHDFWLHDNRLLHQWRKVLRFQVGQEVVLFDGRETERLYQIAELTEQEAHLQLVTDFVRKTPDKDIFLIWSLLKKDKNDWVLQKATELGVSHFIPILADRSEKTGFNVERAEKIVIEAAEQCGRSDIPTVREPMRLQTVFDELKSVPLFVCEQGTDEPDLNLDQLGLIIGPEGGWSDTEKQLFKDRNIGHIAFGDFTLRAETAAIVAAAHLVSIK